METVGSFEAKTLLAHNPSAYDAAYPEPALRRGLPLACLDGKLKAAATAVGVAHFATA